MSTANINDGSVVPLVTKETNARQRLVRQGLRATLGSIGWAFNDDDVVPYDQAIAQGLNALMKSYADNSVVQNDNAQLNDALAAGASVFGSENHGNGSLSAVFGSNSRTGNPSRVFTCAAGGTTLTYTGIDVTSEYFASSDDNQPNIILGYVDSNGVKQIVARTANSVTLSGPDTIIVINAAIDQLTITGLSVDPYWGSFAYSNGYNCLAKGVGSKATGINATANGAYSEAEGISVIAGKQLSKAKGFGATANDFNEEGYGIPWFHDQSDNIDRILRFSGFCEDAHPLILTLDKNLTSDPGRETMTIPDNSVCNCTLYLTAFQSESFAVNYGDCISVLYGFGIKKVANTLTVIGGGGIVPIYYFQDGAGGWSINFDTSGAELSLVFTGQNGVRVRARLVIDQITQF
jgi:hypothetical protein